MPADSLYYEFLAKELNSLLVGGKIDKIYMPLKEDIILAIKAYGKSYNLYISASPARPMMYFIEKRNQIISQDSFSFQTFLRKHLTDSKIDSIENIPYERIIKINVTAKNELKDLLKRTLVIELMGKYTNIIVLDENSIVLECMRHVSLDSSTRNMMVGIKYLPPTAPSKITIQDKQEFVDVLSSFEGGNLAQFLSKNIMGLAPTTIKEVVYRAFKTTSTVEKLDNTSISLLYEKFLEIYNFDNSSPCLLKNGDAYTDFFTRPYYHLSDTFEAFDNLTTATTKFYSTTLIDNYIKNQKNKLLSPLNNAITKTEKKLTTIIENLENAKDLEQDKLKGELVTANIYKIKKGDSKLIAQNYYTENYEDVEILLDIKLSPQKNAEKYYKTYNKKKSAISHSENMIVELNKSIEYLYSLKSLVESLEDEKDFENLEEELIDAKILKPKKSQIKNNKNKNKQILNTNFRTNTINGYVIKTGRNNIQNDNLVKLSKPNDIWLHTKDAHGSHTVIENKSPSAQMPPDNILLIAAQIAAFYSQDKNSDSVLVDYTFIKFVSKQKGASLGKVIYKNQKTLRVNPQDALSSIKGI